MPDELISTVTALAREMAAKAYVSAEHREAVEAILNKRQPVFKRLPPGDVAT